MVQAPGGRRLSLTPPRSEPDISELLADEADEVYNP